MFGTPIYARVGNFVTYDTLTSSTGLVAQNIFWLFSLIPWWALSVRRLHDIDRSGWWILLWLVPMFGWVVMLVFLCLDGTLGRNRYGYDPKGRGTADIFR